MDSEQILFDFTGKNICLSRFFRRQKFCGLPEGRSLRNARSVNGTQKQNAFSGASARFRVPGASFLPILFWQDRKEWAAGGTTRHSGAEKIWPAERRRRRCKPQRAFGASEMICWRQSAFILRQLDTRKSSGSSKQPELFLFGRDARLTRGRYSPLSGALRARRVRRHSRGCSGRRPRSARPRPTSA